VLGKISQLTCITVEARTISLLVYSEGKIKWQQSWGVLAILSMLAKLWKVHEKSDVLSFAKDDVLLEV
jgi:hypothetical protein